MPDQVRHDDQRTFYELILILFLKLFCHQWKIHDLPLRSFLINLYRHIRTDDRTKGASRAFMVFIVTGNADTPVIFLVSQFDVSLGTDPYT